jgi:protein O-mannosyl-transferase
MEGGKPGTDVRKRNILLERPLLWLSLIVILVFFRTVNLGFIRYDDYLFISENKAFNQEMGNIPAAFQRGLFSNLDNTYYRPLFLTDMILEYHLFGENPKGYHLTNVLFHLLSVILLYIFLQKIKISKSVSFLLSSVFAIHPVISQAVAWIPGRNDMLLVIFCLSGLLLAIRYTETGRMLFLLLQFLFFLLALFTKETAVLIPAISLGMLVMIFKAERRNLIFLIVSWCAGIAIWYTARSLALTGREGYAAQETAGMLISRLPAILQYFGKVFLPFNLSVFPHVWDTTVIWGILAVILIGSLLFLAKRLTSRLTVFGLAWFLLFILPVLIVPRLVNDNTFEHRVYLPMIGLLVLFSEVLVLTEKTDRKVFWSVAGFVILALALTSFLRVGYFSDPKTYWTKAVHDSPRSDYALTELVRYTDDMNAQEKLLMEVLNLNPKKPYTNLMLGNIALEKNDPDLAKSYLEAEMKITESSQTYFQLARVFYMKNQLDSTIYYTEKVVGIDPENAAAWNNLVLFYYQAGRVDDALTIRDEMIQRGMEVSEELRNLGQKQ